ncbi:hypothetical protein Tco_1351876 [Tanacetum coccineum]
MMNEIRSVQNVKGDKMNEEERNEEVEVDALYRDMNINLEGRDTEMTDDPCFHFKHAQPSPDTLEPLLLSATTLPPPPTPLITHLQQTPVIHTTETVR